MGSGISSWKDYKHLKDAELVIPITSPFNLPIQLMQKTDVVWRRTVGYHKLEPGSDAKADAIPAVVLLPEQINTSPGTWYGAIDLLNTSLLPCR